MVFPEELKNRLINECVFSATRSSGPGGQNVNKVNTRIELRFNIENSTVLNYSQKHRILLKLNNRINSAGEFLLVSESERTQLGNKLKAIEKFFILIEKALTPQKKRIKTTPTRSSKLKRIESKKIQSMKKGLRKPPDMN